MLDVRYYYVTLTFVHLFLVYVFWTWLNVSIYLSYIDCNFCEEKTFYDFFIMRTFYNTAGLKSPSFYTFIEYCEA